MNVPNENGRVARLTLVMYWGSILFGLTMPWLVLIGHDMLKRRVSLIEAVQDFRLHLFAPGFNFFLVGVLNAIPFVLFAVFILFHLGTAARHDRVIVSRRIVGIVAGLLLGVGLSTYGHVWTITYPDAQGALLYVFMPVYLLILMPLGYGVGRLVGKVTVRYMS